MKKVIKIVCSIILFLGLIALLCCYCIIPERTKESIDIVVEYINTPFGISGISIATFLVFAYKIFQLTSFGRKQYNNCQEEIASDKKKIAELEKANALLLEMVNKGDVECMDRVVNVDTKVNDLTNVVLDIANTIPNAKVNAIAEKVKGGKDNGEETIND